MRAKAAGYSHAGRVDETGLALLGRAIGVPLDIYRPDHVAERTRRALARTGAEDAAALARLAARDLLERARLRRAIAVPVTSERRDPHQFDLLEEQLPSLVRRDWTAVWAAGCADGAELIDVATLLERAGALERATLLGSDLLEENVALARTRPGVAPAIRPRLRFEVRVLPADGAPAGRFDVVLCRNVAIYLTADAQQQLHAVLAGALVPGGVLLLGRSERIADAESLGLDRLASYAYRRAT